MQKTFIPLLVLFIQTSLYSEEDPFNLLNTSVNESFIKVIAKNRASSANDASSYIEINTKEEFLEALENEKLNETIDENKLVTQYRYTEIKNINIRQQDLKDIDGDVLRLGTDVKDGKVSQVLNIKNTNIETDKDIDMSLHLNSGQHNSATSVTNIEGSKLLGGSSLDEESLIDEDDGLLPFNP